jgi:hypothetical protein
MKSLLNAALMLSISAGGAYAQGGNIGGTESRGEPVNSSYRASGVNPTTGYTPGHKAKPRHVKKKSHSRASTTGSGTSSR